jgi:PAS domain S-box-containing protein
MASVVSGGTSETERLEERLRLLSESVRAFGQETSDLERLSNEIVRRISTSLSDACSLWLLDDDGLTLRLAAGHQVEGPGRDRPGMPASLTLDTQPIFRAALDTGRPQLIPSLDLEGVPPPSAPSSVDLNAEVGLHRTLIVGLRVNDRPVGAVLLTRTKPQSPPFDGHDKALAQCLADHAALTIMNARGLAAECRAREALGEVDRVRVHEAQARLAAIVDSSDDAIVSAGLDGTVQSWNAGAERMLGYAATEMVGRSMAILVPPERQEDRAPVAALLARGERVKPFDTVRLHKDGRPVDVSVAMSGIYDGDGRAVGVSTVARDITDRKRVEAQRNRIRALDAENQRIQDASRLKNEFLANMSHELRTPLNAVIGFASLMHDGRVGPISDEQKEYLGDILASSRHLLRLINDVLDLAKVEAGRLVLKPESVSLGPLIAEVLDALASATMDQGVAVSVHVDPELGELVTDARAIKQILFNYLSNAIKFTPRGGSVALSVLPDGATHFLIEVADTGIGIAAADLLRLFVAFQQLDSGAAKHYQGAGLGLALTKRIAQAMGGDVSVASEPGRGSRFLARLPRALPATR